MAFIGPLLEGDKLVLKQQETFKSPFDVVHHSTSSELSCLIPEKYVSNLSENRAGMPVWSTISGKETLINTNCVFYDDDRQAVVCRHLAFEWLCSEQEFLSMDITIHPYQQVFSSQVGINNSRRLAQNFLDYYEIYQYADGYYPFSVDNNGLGMVLQQACADLLLGQQQSFVVSLYDHAMAIIVRYKEKKDGAHYYSIKLYDPNSTLVHKRMVVIDQVSLLQLKYEDFNCLETSSVLSYLTSIRSGVLLRYDAPLALIETLEGGLSPLNCYRKNNFIIIPELVGNINPLDIFHFALKFNKLTDVVMSAVLVHSEEVVARYSSMEHFGIFQAMVYQNIYAIQKYIKMVVESSVSMEVKVALLAAKNCYGEGVFRHALKEGYFKSVQLYLSLVVEALPHQIDPKLKPLIFLDSMDSENYRRLVFSLSEEEVSLAPMLAIIWLRAGGEKQEDVEEYLLSANAESSSYAWPAK